MKFVYFQEYTLPRISYEIILVATRFAVGRINRRREECVEEREEEKIAACICAA